MNDPGEISIRQWNGCNCHLTGMWYCCRLLRPVRVVNGKFCSHEYLHPDGSWRLDAHWYEERGDIVFEEAF